MSRIALAATFAARQLRGDAVAALVAAVMLGIGAGTITFVLSLGAMAAAEATRGLAALGPNVVSVHLVSTDGMPPRRLDAARARRDFGAALAIEDVAALGVAYAPVRVSGHTEPTPVLAIDGPAGALLNLHLAAGTWPDIGEAEARSCVLGHRLAQQAGLDDLLLVAGRPCRAVGILAPSPRHALLPVEMDNAVLVGHAAAARLDVQAPVTQFLLRVPEGRDDAELRSMVRRSVAVAWPWAAPVLRGSGEMIAALREQYARQAMLYAAVASVAVAAATIGLGCMMLAQVRARRRELGVRLAIGALPGDIVMQVLMEAALMGLVGGGVGNLGALLLLGGVAAFSELDFAMDPAMAAATLIATVLAGALAGAAPAMIAARTDPVHSIRT
jgi:putative ABC transport system permease protein